MSVRPRLLDLFCGAGGCSIGYDRAGFDVTGVDIEDRKDYPYRLWQDDANRWMRQLLMGHIDARGRFDVIHASPPCQALTTMSNRYRGKGGKTDEHINLIPEMRELLQAWGGVYVIENVPGARPYMRDPITLHGGMFNLQVNRPRLFESNVPLTAPKAPRVKNPLGIYGRSPDGRRLFTRVDGTSQYAAASLEAGRAAMGVGWMTDWADITEAIPPAYTEHIGAQLLDVISRDA